MRYLTAFAISLLLSTAAFADAPKAGPNGGIRVDAGTIHVELVLDGTENVKAYLLDFSDKPLTSAGVKANAILIVDGKPVRFTLEDMGGTMLHGKAPAPVAAGAKGALQLTMPDGSTLQAKY